ncbi:MAG: hypothetical protein IPI67_40190 [Myxococcales bacterium]|nr:hypothetical protein [Myxococcales bacterium]
MRSRVGPVFVVAATLGWAAGCLDIGDTQPAGGAGGFVATGGAGASGTGSAAGAGAAGGAAGVGGGSGGASGTDAGGGAAVGGAGSGGAGGSGTGGGTSFQVRGVVFDGVTNWLDSKFELNGATDSKQVAGSIWFKRVGLGSTYCIGPEAAGSNSPNQLEWNASDQFRLVWRKAGGGVALDFHSATVTDTASWHHVLFSADLSDPNTRHLYLDGVSSITVDFYSHTLMDNTGSQWGVFGDNGGNLKYKGEVAEMWLAMGTYVDFSLAANRAKFRDANGKPVDLGASGALPTGTAPMIYLSLRPGQAASEFAKNRGSGAGFTPQGQLVVAQTSPSD